MAKRTDRERATDESRRYKAKLPPIKETKYADVDFYFGYLAGLLAARREAAKANPRREAKVKPPKMKPCPKCKTRRGVDLYACMTRDGRWRCGCRKCGCVQTQQFVTDDVAIHQWNTINREGK
jgi:hypothetical protein